MATIENQLLSIRKTSELIETASVRFEVCFTDREIFDNISFGIFMLLMERDEEFERFHKTANGVFSFSFSPFNLTNSGNHICWMANRTVQPNGTSKVQVDFTNEVVATGVESDQGRYRVYIFVMPEVLCGQAWTNEVCVNYN